MLTRAHRDREERRQRQAAPQPPRVFVADDDTDLRRMLAYELLAAGYDVTEARTGEELLDHLGEALLSGKRSAQPDVIISDIRMPGLFGLEILAGLRAANWRTRMIVMTAYADGATRERVALLGAAALFEKPFEIGDLLAVMRDVNPRWRWVR